MFSFSWWWLLLVLPLPWLVRRFLPAVTERRQAALKVPFFEQIRHLQSTAAAPLASSSIPYLAWLMWGLLVLAAMRPQWLGEPVDLPLSGRDLMLGVDVSGSMREQDFQINGRTVTRLQAVKKVGGEFIERRRGDRLGLILFGDNAYIQTPMTYDLKTVRHFLDESVIGLVGMSTAIGEAIGLSIKRLRQRPEESRVLLLLTDGANTAGSVLPLDAARLAAQEHVKIYTIGVGAEQVTRRDLFGTRVVNPSVDLDETTLKEVARITGGQYFRARNTREMERIYAAIDKLEPTLGNADQQRPLTELFFIPLCLALIVSAIQAWQVTRPDG